MIFQAFPSRRAMLALLPLFLSLCVAGTPQAQAFAPMDERQALHLLNRLGYGPAPGEVERMGAMDVGAYVDSQLAPPPMPPRRRERLDESAPAAAQSLLGAIASPRQLEEVLTSFWLDYFIDTDDAARAALRPRVPGRYAHLRAGVDQTRRKAWSRSRDRYRWRRRRPPQPPWQPPHAASRQTLTACAHCCAAENFYMIDTRKGILRSATKPAVTSVFGNASRSKLIT